MAVDREKFKRIGADQRRDLRRDLRRFKLQTAITFDTDKLSTRELIHVEEDIELDKILSN